MAGAIKAVIFDMDGTITVPVLDFPRMKAEIGIPQDQGLLESLSAMGEGERSAAEAVLLRHELAAAHDSELNAGVVDALDSLSRMGVLTAILTRNCAESVRIVTAKHSLRFDAVVSREDSKPKPDPDGVLVAASRLGVSARSCLVIGDYEFDIQAGRAAGSVTVLFSPSGRSFQTVADFQIRSMGELPALVGSLA
jgi:HAD superfamily hydrolase (TIGR01509 family)